MPSLRSNISLLPLGLIAVLTAGLLAPDKPGFAEPVVPSPIGVRSTTIRLDSQGATFLVRGIDADFRYTWTPDPEGGGALAVSRVGVTMPPIIARYRTAWTGQARLISRHMTKDANGVHLNQTFDVDGKRTTLTSSGHIAGGSLIIDMAERQSLISSVKLEMQTASNIRRHWLPYSPIDIYYAKAGKTFASLFLDWTRSDATRIDSDGASYLLRSDRLRNAANERLIFSASSKVAGVMPNSSWPQSRYYEHMAGRMIVDVTVTDHFGDIERELASLRDAGLSNCVVVVHAWQKWGYDNGLPDVLPPNEFLGGKGALAQIGALARTMQCDFALHQNYIDLYPNASMFDRKLLALDKSANPIKGWYNQASKAQSYIVKPGAFTALASSVAPQIHDTLGTTGAFIDVNSSFAPWERVDMDSREKDGGKFRPFLQASKSLFVKLQDTEQGPLLGEGGQHFYWTGAVDGVEADMLARPRVDPREAPLWVDFDLTKIHPLQQNYGMGYYERFQLGHVSLNQEERDIYRMQQIAFGHLPYQSGLEWGDPRIFVQEAGLAWPVAKSYGRAKVSEVRYRMSNRWNPIELALPAEAGRIVRVKYDNGLIVTANSDKTPVADDAGTILSPAGWSARGKGIAGYSSAVLGARRDFMKGPGTIYADPRGVTGNWNASGTANGNLIDFGDIRTNGQTWMRCDKGTWTIIGFARRGSVDLEVTNSIMAQPSWLRPMTGSAASVTTVSPASWRVRLVSGQRYASPVRCTGDN